VRRYAYDRLTAPDRAAAHAHLRDYFAAVPKADKVQSLDDLLPVIELYHHTVRAGQYDEARTLFRDRINQAAYYQFGAYQLQIELLRAFFPDGEDKPPRLKDESAQAWTLNELANSYSLSGQPECFAFRLQLSRKLSNKTNVAIGRERRLSSGHRRTAGRRGQPAPLDCRVPRDQGRVLGGGWSPGVGSAAGVPGRVGRIGKRVAALAMFEKQHVRVKVSWPIALCENYSCCAGPPFLQ
jgi:hypothetical protein